ncbi:MAG: hypothetical protein IPL77_18150 [Flavobacteriales bacterium]|nr:hypothetical protein [Flavobacteriales bacterium]
MTGLQWLAGVWLTLETGLVDAVGDGVDAGAGKKLNMMMRVHDRDFRTPC